MNQKDNDTKIENLELELINLKKFIFKNFKIGKKILELREGANAFIIYDGALKKEISDDNKLKCFIDALVLDGFISCREIKRDAYNTIKHYYSTYKLYIEIPSKNTLFFAREFDNAKTKLFYDKLKTLIESQLGFDVIMLEEDPIAGNIQSRIKNEIKNCQYFIADLTYKKSDKLKNLINGNVMYEIGMAKAYNKPVLLIINEEVSPFVQNNDTDFPFDITSHTTISYGYDNENHINSIINCIKSAKPI